MSASKQILPNVRTAGRWHSIHPQERCEGNVSTHELKPSSWCKRLHHCTLWSPSQLASETVVYPCPGRQVEHLREVIQKSSFFMEIFQMGSDLPPPLILASSGTGGAHFIYGGHKDSYGGHMGVIFWITSLSPVLDRGAAWSWCFEQCDAESSSWIKYLV